MVVRFCERFIKQSFVCVVYSNVNCQRESCLGYKCSKISTSISTHVVNIQEYLKHLIPYSRSVHMYTTSDELRILQTSGFDRLIWIRFDKKNYNI